MERTEEDEKEDGEGLEEGRGARRREEEEGGWKYLLEDDLFGPRPNKERSKLGKIFIVFNESQIKFSDRGIYKTNSEIFSSGLLR
jgi:hypothetical protein